MRLTQKNIAILALILLFSVVLTACGTDKNDADASKTASASPAATQQAQETPSAAAEQPTTRKVKHALGETEIPTEPKRIVADQYIGHLLALGIKPIGARGDLMKSPFLQEQFEGVADTGSPMNLEKVLELKPDLIIVQSEDNYEQLSKIAPTIVYEYGKINTLQQLKLFGDILGKQKEADEWIAAFDAKAKSYREKLAGAVGPDETVSVIELWAEGPFVFGNNWGRGGYSLYNALQLKPPAIVANEIIDKEQFRALSMEVLPDYVGDFVFLTVYAENGGDKKAQEIKDSAIWKSLKAVKNNRIIELRIEDMAPGDPISLDKQMDIQFEKLLALKK